MKFLTDLWASKKFRMTLAGIAATIINSYLAFLPQGVIDQINQLIMVYVGAQGVADVAKVFAKPTAGGDVK